MDSTVRGRIDCPVALSSFAVTSVVPAGALFVPMNQPAAGIVAAALEPDSPGSYLGVGIVPMEDGESEAPVYRVMTDLPFWKPR